MMKSRIFKLKSFEDARGFQMEAAVQVDLQSTKISFSLDGPLDEVEIPDRVSKPGFQDRLWEQSCFEAFFAESTLPSYVEWNFSPSGNWAAFAFSNYRRKSADIKTTSCTVDFKWINPGRIELHSILGSPLKISELQISSIVYLKNKTKLHFALAHTDRPDFHQRKLFQKL